VRLALEVVRHARADAPCVGCGSSDCAGQCP
jgi:hypothetical protein